MNRRKPRPQRKTQEQCPACGYCPHCGQSARPVIVPPINPYFSPIPWMPVPWVYRPLGGTVTLAPNLSTTAATPTVSLQSADKVYGNDYKVTAWNLGNADGQVLNFGGSMISDS